MSTAVSLIPQYKYQQHLIWVYFFPSPPNEEWMNCISSWALVGHLPELQYQRLEFLDIDLSELLVG